LYFNLYKVDKKNKTKTHSVAGNLHKRLNKNMRLFKVSIIFLSLTTVIFSQSISGYLLNDQNQPLIGGSISILGTNMGVAANNDGFYRIKLHQGIYNIVVSNIGYQSDTVLISIKENQDLRKDFSLKPATILLEEILVFSKNLNSAEEIILKAIDRKEEYLKKIRNYEYSAFSKTTFILKPDSNKEVIGGLTEVLSKGFFQAPNNFQEVILAKRQTANFSEVYNIFSSGRILSTLDDVLNIDELSVISPLNKNALNYYHFNTVDTTYYDSRRVFNIAFKPKNNTLPLFEGKISIIDGLYCVIAVQLIGGERIKSTIKSDIKIRQSFREFEGYFWFPIQYDIAFNLDIGLPNVKKIYIHQLSHLTDYVFNSKSFNHKFNNMEHIESNLSTQENDSVWHSSQYIELTKSEKDTYRSIDSSMAVKNFLAKFLIELPGLYLKIKQLPITELWDFYHNDRVEGNYIGLGANFNNVLGLSKLMLTSGYGFSDKRTKYDFDFGYNLEGNMLEITGDLDNSIKFLNGMYDYRKYDITFQKIFFNNDYADYYYSRGWGTGLNLDIDRDIRISLSFSHSLESNTSVNSDFSLFNTNESQRKTVPILTGNFNELKFSFAFDNRRYNDFGWGYIQNFAENYFRFEFDYEIAPQQIFENNYPYQQLYILLNSFSKLNSYLNIKILAESGYLDNDTLSQKFFHLPGTYGSYSGSNLFRTIKEDSYMGNSYTGIFIENNFKNTIFNLLSIPFLKNSKYDLYIFSNYGWINAKPWSNGTIINNKTNSISEAGFGIGNILFYLRFDFTWRITPMQGNNFYFNVSSIFNY
jgi:hypothetical protein